MAHARPHLFAAFSIFIFFFCSSARPVRVCAWAGPCHFYPSPNDLWISLFASIRILLFSFFGRLFLLFGIQFDMRSCHTSCEYFDVFIIIIIFFVVVCIVSYMLWYERRGLKILTECMEWMCKPRVNQIVVANSADTPPMYSAFDFSFRLLQFRQHFVWFLFIYFCSVGHVRNKEKNLVEATAA